MLHNWVAEKLFDRSLWKPCETTVARGVGLGISLAMVPIPFQVVLAVAGACFMSARLGVRVNLPAAALAVWVSNPVTIAPLLMAQYRLGAAIISWPLVPVYERFERAQALMVGVGIFAVGGAALGYLVTVLLWDLFSHHILPVAVKGRGKGRNKRKGQAAERGHLSAPKGRPQSSRPGQRPGLRVPEKPSEP